MDRAADTVARLRDRLGDRLGDRLHDRVRARSRRRGPAEPAYRHVVVVTYGRSGSTLVQGLLNTMPRTLVRGENNLYVLPLFRAWDAVRTFRATHLGHGTRAPHSAFYGLEAVRPELLVSSARTTVRQHLLGDVEPSSVDVLGFKEVAWHRIREPETEGFFDFLEQVLPGCRYVLNVREREQVFGSGYWKGSSREQVDRKVRRVEAIQDHLRATRPDRTLTVRYEHVTSDDGPTADAELTALAEFVTGACPPELLERLHATRSVGHGPFPFGASRVEGPAARGRRRDATD